MQDVIDFLSFLQTVQERTKQRRSQMMMHSYIYYALGNNIISDFEFDKWAKELVMLNLINPNINFYDDEFKNWTGDTGFHLPIPQWIKDKAKYLWGLDQ